MQRLVILNEIRASRCRRRLEFIADMRTVNAPAKNGEAREHLENLIRAGYRGFDEGNETMGVLLYQIYQDR